MKKIFILFFILIALPLYAQDNKKDNQLAIKDNRTWINSEYKTKFPYPVTAGGTLFVSMHNLLYNESYFGRNSGRQGFGGGLALNGKVSLKKWLAVSLDMSIGGGKARDYYSDGFLQQADYTHFLITPMVLLQHETPRGQAGWAYWTGIGLSLAVNSLDVNVSNNHNTKFNINSTSVGLGFALGGGFRYNFKNNIYVGARFDYTLSGLKDPIYNNTVNFPYYAVDQYSAMNYFKIGFESGYRF